MCVCFAVNLSVLDTDKRPGKNIFKAQAIAHHIDSYSLSHISTHMLTGIGWVTLVLMESDVGVIVTR